MTHKGTYVVQLLTEDYEGWYRANFFLDAGNVAVQHENEVFNDSSQGNGVAGDIEKPSVGSLTRSERSRVVRYDTLYD